MSEGLSNTQILHTRPAGRAAGLLSFRLVTGYAGEKYVTDVLTLRSWNEGDTPDLVTASELAMRGERVKQRPGEKYPGRMW